MIVMDCSAAVEIVRGTPLGSGFQALILEGEEIIAPALLYSEVCNVFWKYAHAKLMGKNEALEHIMDALELVEYYVDLPELSLEAFSEAVRVDHSVYDLYYVVLARRNAATLLTADRKLMALAESLGVDCAQIVEI